MVENYRVFGRLEEKEAKSRVPNAMRKCVNNYQSYRQFVQPEVVV